MSLEEEKSRIDKEKATGKPAELAESKTADDEMAIDEDDEETMMAKAISMSLETAAKESNSSKDAK